MSVPRLKRMKDSPIQPLQAPRRARIPANGLMPVVTAGDRVAAGDLVLTSRAGSALQYRRHAPLTGVVSATGPDLVIEGESDEVRPLDIAAASIVETVREAGLVGMGGGGFPTYAKLDVADGGIDTVIVNACESEPYVTCDHRVLIEQRAGVEDGLRLAREVLQAERGIVIGTDATYPGGDERILVERILGRKVPPFKRPMNVGAVVLNAQTALAIHRAVVEGRPLVDRVITVDGGGVGRPGNYLVPIGTEIGHILNACKTDLSTVEVVLSGGPMMGVRAQLDTPVTAGTIAVLALTKDEISRPVDDPCIRCGQCLAVCPYGLAPGRLLRSPSPSVLRCVGCGACEFVCPSRRALVSHLHDLKRRYQDGSGALVR